MKPPNKYLKGRGAQINTPNPYEKHEYEARPHLEENQEQVPTQFIEVHPKTIINKVKSPDIPAEYSLNPYQGCEHGCIYCYARNTHPYWGYSAGLEFEQKILLKKEAPQVLRKQLSSKKWKAAPIMIAGNTDCYQPIEKKLEITRHILQICWEFRHPVSLITKNSLVLRDLDILQKLAEKRLLRVAISITTLNEELRQKMEPRTASIKQRLHTVETLANNNIPVFVMMAPIIPSLNDHEIIPLVKKVAELGAYGVGYTMVRLNGDVGTIFKDWIEQVYPNKASKVLKQIADTDGGSIEDKRFGTRMRGKGHIADIIHQQFKVAKQKFLKGRQAPPYDLELFGKKKNPQLRLFD